MKIAIKHVFLKELRESRNVPIEVMLHKLNLSKDDYQKFENVDFETDEDNAERIANILGYNWSVFLLDKQPVFKKNVDNRTLENKTAHLSKKTILAVEDANFILSFYSGLPNKQELKLPKFEDIENSEPEDLANKLRESSGITTDVQEKFTSDSDALNRWINYIESLGILVSQYNLDLDDKVRAFSVLENGQAIIVLNTSDLIPARSFSLFHELGHIIRRTEGLCDLHSSKDKDVETYCNRFAAAFLAPAKFIDSYIQKEGKSQILSNLEWHVSKISSKLKISKLAVYRRLATLGLIDNSKYMEFHNKYLKFNFTKPVRAKTEDGSKPRGGGNFYLIAKQKNGEFYSKNVFEAYDYGYITPMEASSALGVSIGILDKYRSWPAIEPI